MNTPRNTPKQYSKLIERVPNCPDTNGWKQRHIEACINPRPGFERALVRMLRGWLEYAEIHEGQFESSIGDDGVLGPEWEAIGDALRGLLNGEAGRLDCGTVDGIILDAMRDSSVDLSGK